MSTLRINNIEAQSIPASPTIDEKVKVTNSSGDILVNIDGKTSGITTIGINTTDGNIKFDANSNVLITGILTATTLAGNFTPDSLEIGSNIKLGNAGVVTATSFVGSGANLTSLPAQATIANNADNRVITGGSGVNLNGEANMTFDGSLLKIASRAVIGNGSEYQIPSRSNTSSYTPQFQITGAWNNPTHGATLALNGRNDYPLIWLNSGASFADNSGCGVITWSIKDGAGNYCNTAEIRSLVDGTPGNNDSPGDLSFRTTPDGTCQATERLRIDSSGRVVIGGNYTPYAGSNMEIRSTDAGGSTELRITNNATNPNTKAGVVFTCSTGDYGTGKIFYERNAGSNSGSDYDALCFDAWSHGSAGAGGLTGNENAHMYLWGQCATGNGGQYQGLGIGTNFPANRYGGNGFNSNGAACFFAPLGSNAITLMSTSPVSGGYNDIIGINFAAHNYGTHQSRSGIYYQIKCKNGHGSYGDRGQLYLQPGYDGQSSQGQGVVFEFNGHTLPTSDNGQYLGNGSLRWAQLYAGNGSINTSDETKKQNIVGLTTSEMNAAARISKLFKTYKWKDSVTKKGDTARTHVGVTAQSIKTEMEAEGLSAAHYGFWCEDHGWYDSKGEYVGDGLTSGPGVYDELTDTTPTTVGFTSTTIYGVRYEELLSFLAAYNEQRFTSIESRLTALEGS